MSELENLKQENEKLKKDINAFGVQMINAQQQVDNFANQVEAYKGELSDARTISFQLRMSLGRALSANQSMTERLKVLEAQIDKMKKEKADSVSLKSIENKQNKAVV